LNSILDLNSPIVDLTLENPFNMQDFQEDKLSNLDIKAIDQSGAIHNVEMQISLHDGFTQRIVFYGCELVIDQMRGGDDYKSIRPVFSICILGGILFEDGTKLHHRFRLMDEETLRTLDKTLEIHTLELGRYNLGEADLATASELDWWLYWLLHAHEYEVEALLALFPKPAFRQATQTILRIAQKTEDKAMYDSREKAIRDRQWQLNSAIREGEIKGEIKGKIEGKIEGEAKLVQTLQSLLYLPISSKEELLAMSLKQLEELASGLQEKLRSRISS
jgi:predicted transposase/invertase (TIGR01784 family)